MQIQVMVVLIDMPFLFKKLHGCQINGAVYIRINIKDFILKYGAFCQNLLEFKTRWKCFIKYVFYFRILSFKLCDDFLHGHKLIACHEQDQVCLFSDFQAMEIIHSIGWDNRKVLLVHKPYPLFDVALSIGFRCQESFRCRVSGFRCQDCERMLSRTIRFRTRSLFC